MIIPVNELNTPELQIYSSQNETQLKHYYEPAPGIFIAETENVILRALKAGYEPISLLMDSKYLGTEVPAAVGDIPVYTASMEVLSVINGFRQTRGILCAMKRKPLPAPEEILQKARKIAVLEDVENPTNVGAIFRSAAALGIEAVIMTFGSADPFYRRAARVSMGTAFMIPHTYMGNKWGGWPNPGISKLHEAGFSTIAMALSDRAVSLADPMLKSEEKTAVIFGNEENGIRPDTLEQCRHIVKIPMQNDVDSLNVAAASAVAFWELCR